MLSSLTFVSTSNVCGDLSSGTWKVMVTVLNVPASTVDFIGSMVNSLE